jgi:DNA-binding NarL/FixJ family response regulator
VSGMSSVASGENTIRVLIADDHPVVRSGLAGMLAAEPGLTVVGEAANGEQALELAAESHPHVVLMDLRMPVLDGTAATARLSREQPDVRVLILTTYDTDGDILRAVEAGAIGYLLKDASRAELADAVRAAARGETVLAPVAAASLLTRVRAQVVGGVVGPSAGMSASTGPGSGGFGGSAGAGSGGSARPTLTAREIQVLGLVAEGHTNSEIGKALYIGEATVKTHLMRAFGKLGVDDRTAAVTAAMRHGLLPYGQ